MLLRGSNVEVLDFAKIPGGTIVEKYEGVYAACHKLCGELGWPKFAITSPEIASIFETACVGFYPSSELQDYMFDDYLNYVGVVGQLCEEAKPPFRMSAMAMPRDSEQKGLRLFKSPSIPVDEMYFCGESGLWILKIE
jgi:hypothetical protein